MGEKKKLMWAVLHKSLLNYKSAYHVVFSATTNCHSSWLLHPDSPAMGQPGKAQPVLWTHCLLTNGNQICVESLFFCMPFQNVRSWKDPVL